MDITTTGWSGACGGVGNSKGPRTWETPRERGRSLCPLGVFPCRSGLSVLPTSPHLSRSRGLDSSIRPDLRPKAQVRRPLSEPHLPSRGGARPDVGPLQIHRNSFESRVSGSVSLAGDRSNICPPLKPGQGETLVGFRGSSNCFASLSRDPKRLTSRSPTRVVGRSRTGVAAA